ncbi:MAG: NAD(P)H-hydrate dehydratase [Endomicrobiia bacterium]|nr:NAD(P)H-hydrate dehydratase [Endomicrobiaceae bacterium]MDD3053213.1 NAD(P)H-hydrate dehydratase [Endomicrobiaceae bacterium]MDD3922296.1 NAD(P)H-hydrate dehydratase [Endomicrobiaceae bacterium]MDD5102090.1 NAD(P)H-hydrate dehydratase [Endomicrobiaceae bacterium]
MKIHNIFDRSPLSYKNDFGHILVIGSSYNMPGAGVLCANSAIRSGAGLVTFAFPESAYPVIAKNIKPEIMLLPLKEKNKKITNKAQKEILEFIEKKNIKSVAIGCGVGQDINIKQIIKSIINKFDIYVVIDADGINSFQKEQKNGVIKDFVNAKAKIIITPHPKEFERISGITYNSTDFFREQITKTFAKNNDIICVLKGHRTVVSDGNNIYNNNTGNAGMATAGSGDVLTGIISAFVCNKDKSLILKVATAVYIHGLAGDKASKEKTQTSLIASDIIDNIASAIRSIK